MRGGYTKLKLDQLIPGEYYLVGIRGDIPNPYKFVGHDDNKLT